LSDLDVSPPGPNISSGFTSWSHLPLTPLIKKTIPLPIRAITKAKNIVLFRNWISQLTGSGIVFLIKGVRGKWDQDVKPEDMLGPGGDTSKSDKPNSDETA